MTDSFCLLNNTVRDIMCDRCAKEVKAECFAQPTDESRTLSMVKCMRTILEPDDEKYPVKFRKVK
jgi:hypothetical protein